MRQILPSTTWECQDCDRGQIYAAKGEKDTQSVPRAFTFKMFKGCGWGCPPVYTFLQELLYTL